MVFMTILATIYLIYTGYSYYALPLEERFYHPNHDWFKPSGIYGHGLGILGTCMMLFGVGIYILRKRYNFMARQLRLKYLLEFHIFLCTLGPILILFHTAFKFGGIVSVAFWSMVAVVLSGVIGRFIYIQIPHSIEGRALSLKEVQEMRTELGRILKEKFEQEALLAPAFIGGNEGVRWLDSTSSMRELKKLLSTRKFPPDQRREILALVKSERSLSQKIDRLQRMQQLFKYWHVAHLPFALIMLVIVVLHVAVTLAFGYKWIF